MRLVIFNPFHPPVVNPRSLRMDHLLRFAGRRIDAIMITNPVAGVRIEDERIKLHGWAIHPARRPGSVFISGILRRLKSFFFPDIFAFNSIWHAFRYASKYSSPGDVIYTCSHPVSTHLAALVLRKIQGRKFLWIADAGDRFHYTWSGWRGRLMFRFERIVFSNAGRLVFNSEFLRDAAIRDHGLSPAKCIVIPNPPVSDKVGITEYDSSVTELRYLGNTYAPVRTGIPELTILSRIVTELRSAGKASVILLTGQQDASLMKAFRGDENVIFEPQVAPSGLAEKYSRSHILISLGNVFHTGLPSKLAEYLRSGLPLIHFFHDEDDPAISFLRDRPRCMLYSVKDGDPVRLKDFILRSATFEKSPVVMTDDDAHWAKLLDELNKWPEGAKV